MISSSRDAVSPLPTLHYIDHRSRPHHANISLEIPDSDSENLTLMSVESIHRKVVFSADQNHKCQLIHIFRRIKNRYHLCRLYHMEIH